MESWRERERKKSGQTGILQYLCAQVNDLPEGQIRNKLVGLVEEGAWTARYRPWEKLKGNLADAGSPLNVTLTEECEPADDVVISLRYRSIDNDDKFLKEEERKNPE